MNTFASSIPEGFGVPKASLFPASPSNKLFPKRENEPQVTEPYRDAARSHTVGEHNSSEFFSGDNEVARHTHNVSETNQKAVVNLLLYFASITYNGFGSSMPPSGI